MQFWVARQIFAFFVEAQAQKESRPWPLYVWVASHATPSVSRTRRTSFFRVRKVFSVS